VLKMRWAGAPPYRFGRPLAFGALRIAKLSRLAGAAGTAQRQRCCRLLNQARAITVSSDFGTQRSLHWQKTREMTLDRERHSNRGGKVSWHVAERVLMCLQPLCQL
jgi:hypothetical protein